MNNCRNEAISFRRFDPSGCFLNCCVSRSARLSHIGWLQDTQGENVSLQYLRTKDGKEVDFAVCKGDKIVQLIEVKYAEDRISKNLRYFSEKLSEAVQLVHQLRHEQSIQNVSLLSASRWLADLAA